MEDLKAAIEAGKEAAEFRCSVDDVARKCSELRLKPMAEPTA
jgi:hypothetical protein